MSKAIQPTEALKGAGRALLGALLPGDPKDENPAELERLEQKHAEIGVKVEAAEANVRDASAKFDETGDATSEKRLVAAEDALRSAQRHHGRAGRLVEAERARIEAARMARLKAEAEALEAELHWERVKELAAPGVEEELAALLAVVAVRRKRTEARSEHKAKLSRWKAVQRAMGVTVRYEDESRMDHGGQISSSSPVASAVRSEVARLRETDRWAAETLDELARDGVGLARLPRPYVAPPIGPG